MTDIIIIGGGPAGLTAALYAHRAGHSVVVLEGAILGGQAVNTPHVENWPGTITISGPDYAMNLVEQANRFEIPIKYEQAENIAAEDGFVSVKTSSALYKCHSIILAIGLKRRTLNIPGEEKFAGRGVSYCAICDGNFFKGKTVAVIGDGNTAVEDAIYMASLCQTVYLINRKTDFTAQEYLVDHAKTFSNINILLGYSAKEIIGDKNVTSLKLLGESEEKTIDVNGIFVAIGFAPQNAVFSPPILLDEDGFIKAGEDCTTNIKGIFAAGDCRSKDYRQLVTATSDGAIAATKAGEYLLKNKSL